MLGNSIRTSSHLTLNFICSGLLICRPPCWEVETMPSAKGQTHAKTNIVARPQECPWRTGSVAARQLPDQVSSQLYMGAASPNGCQSCTLETHNRLWYPKKYVTQLSMRNQILFTGHDQKMGRGEGGPEIDIHLRTAGKHQSGAGKLILPEKPYQVGLELPQEHSPRSYLCDTTSAEQGKACTPETSCHPLWLPPECRPHLFRPLGAAATQSW